jgi:flavin-dependent dehydrogenase
VTDVLVVGSGPAGSAAATLLARWGHRVNLITKPAPNTVPLGESIPPSTGKLLDVLGIRGDVDAAGFVRATGNTVWWGRTTPRLEYFGAGERGWQVTTTALETVLRAVVAAAGVEWETRRLTDRDVAGARYVLDCSGRAGILARARRLRVHDEAFHTIAMVGLWGSPRFSLPEPTHTVVESYDGGWAWSVPEAIERRFVAVMIDPRTRSRREVAAPVDAYLHELARAAQFTHILAGATLLDGPRGWDASMYHATRYVDDNVLLVGDAASFIDPLSSAGIKKALASGWLAAVATHTALVNPPMRDAALAFFSARERDVYASFHAMTERYWRDAAGGHAHPFWTDRAGDEDSASNDEAERRAFDQIRLAPDLRLELSPDVRIAARAAVSGNEILMEDRLTRSGSDAGVRFINAVDMIALAELAPVYTSVPDLFEAYNRRRLPVELPVFLATLATSIAEQWLRWCDTN